MAKEPINITNLLSKEDDRRVVFAPRVVFATPVFPPLLLGQLLSLLEIIPGQHIIYVVLSLLPRILIVVSCVAAMLPKVDLVARQAMEAATAARVAEKRKKRAIVQAGQYELKRIRRDTQDDLA